MSNEVFSSDFLKVLLALKANINKDLKVADVAKVIQISNDSVNCQIITDNTNVSCIALQNIALSIGDTVLILYTDSDFRTNLKRIKENQATQTVSSELHTKNYGVIVGIVYKEEIE